MKIERPQPRTGARFFFSLAFGWSLLFWLLTVVSGGITRFPGSILQYVGGAGPLVAALTITHFFEPLAVRRDFWSRTLDPRHIPWRWLLPSLLLHPAILLLAFAVDLALGGTLERQASDLSGAGAVIALAATVFVLGPLPEEMGWRGVGYDRLQSSSNALVASLLLGAAWATWHIPLFLIEGTFQNQLGFGSARFWIFLASNVPLTVIITWIYSHTRRSTLSAVFVHFSGNMVGALLAKTDRLALLELVGLILVAILLIARSGVGLRQPLDAGRHPATPTDQ
jgi:membrane protease YdiL (CAAX protease family)